MMFEIIESWSTRGIDRRESVAKIRKSRLKAQYDIVMKSPRVMSCSSSVNPDFGTGGTGNTNHYKPRDLWYTGINKGRYATIG